MVTISKSNPNGVNEYIADTLADKDEMQTNSLSMGSSVLVLENGSVFMLTSSKEWKEI